MKPINFIVYFLIFISSLFCTSNTQAQIDSVLIEEGLSGYNYFYKGEEINGNRVLEIIEKNTEAYDIFQSAHEAHIFSNIFGVTGILLIVMPAGMQIAGYDANWSMAWAGGGLMIVSIPLFYKYNKNIPVAIDMYNSNTLNIKEESRLQFNFGATKNGIGLCLKF